MLHGATHLIAVIRYVQKLLAYVMHVIRYVTYNNTPFLCLNVWPQIVYIRYACHKVCCMELHILFQL